MAVEKGGGKYGGWNSVTLTGGLRAPGGKLFTRSWKRKRKKCNNMMTISLVSPPEEEKQKHLLKSVRRT